jgi:hypothetical protein
MLSPNAMKRVDGRLGRRVTWTDSVQLALCPAASCALHVTVAVPGANEEPAAGEQFFVIGADPPDVIGAGNWTGTGSPLGDSAVTFAGHVMVRVSLGPLGECPLQVAAATQNSSSTARARTPALTLATDRETMNGGRLSKMI